jgi:hypothetical protein
MLVLAGKWDEIRIAKHAFHYLPSGNLSRSRPIKTKSRREFFRAT